MNEQRGHPIEDPKVSRQAAFAKPLTASTIVRLAGVSGGHSAAFAQLFAHLFAHLSDLVTGCTPPSQSSPWTSNKPGRAANGL